MTSGMAHASHEGHKARVAGVLAAGACAVAAVLLSPAPAAAQRIENQVAVFAALDKVTAKISRLEVPLNQTATFVEVDETQLDGKDKRIFTGWMFADSPGLNAVEHPVFDVWLTDCAQPRAVAQRPQPGGAAPGAEPQPADPDQFRRRRVPR